MTKLTREQLDVESARPEYRVDRFTMVAVPKEAHRALIAMARRALELEELLSQVAAWKSAMSDWYKELDRERPEANGMLVYKDRVQERLVRISLMLPTCSPDDAINAALDAAEKSRE